MSMKLKLSIMSSFLVVLVIGSISATLFFFDKKLLVENKKESQSVLFESYVKICEDAIILDDRLVLLDFSSVLQQTNPSIVYILFHLNDGSIISSGQDEMIYFATRKLGKKGVKNPSGYLIRETLGPGGDEIVDFSRSVKIDNQSVGTAQIGFSAAVLEKELSSVLRKMRQIIIIVACGAILIGIIGSFVFALHMMKPIKKLAEGASLIGAGQFDHRIHCSSHDELGWLAGEFNKMGDKLQELDQMKNDFISNVTHELRSPLGAIKSYIEILEQSTDIPPELKEHISRIPPNLQRLSTFIDNLLDIARIEQDKFTLHITEASLDKIANRAVDNFQTQAGQKGIHLTSKISSILPKIHVDPERLDQVFSNLLGNALKFTSANGRICIDAQEMSRSKAPHFGQNVIRVSVSDTGAGIPPDDLKRIFNKFEQVQSNRADMRGTGIGLSIVKGIIEAHGGQIWVTSRLGKGTTFYFTLKTSDSAVLNKV
ncbi:MAG: HAMP domain-containing sensor histidine kinase [bacterium]